MTAKVQTTKTLLAFCLVLGMLLTGGCGEEPTPSTKLAVAWYRSPSLYAVRRTVGFDDPEAIYDNYPEYPTNTIFWHAEGEVAEVPAPSGGLMEAAWSEYLGKVILICIEGVYVADLSDQQIRPIYVPDRSALLYARAIGPTGRLVLVDASHFDSDEYRVILLDLRDGAQASHVTSDGATGMTFLTDRSAVISTKSALIAATRQADGWEFSPMPVDGEPGRVVGSRGDRPLLATESGLDVPGIGEVDCSGRVRLAAASADGAVFALTGDDRVLRISDSGRTEQVAAFQPDTMTGSGELPAGGLWVATGGGRVHVFDGPWPPGIHKVRLVGAAE